MALMSGKAYIDSLRALKVRAFAFGKRIENQLEHELTAPAHVFRRFVGKDLDLGNPKYGV